MIADSSRRAISGPLAIVHRAEDVLLALLLGTIIVLAPLQIVLRNFFDAGLVWADPFLRLLVLWVALCGALAASRQDRQISIDIVSKFLSARARAVVGVVTGSFTAFVCGVVAYHASLFVMGERAFGSTAFSGIPAWLCQIVIPYAFAMLTLRHLGHAFTQARSAIGPTDGSDRAEGSRS